MIDRRRFIASAATGAAAAALPLAGCVRSEPAAGTSASSSLAERVRGADGSIDWEAVRREFLLDPSWVHLSSFYLVSHPRSVREAIERYRRRLDENPIWIEEVLFGQPEANLLTRVKEGLAAYTGGRVDEFAITPNTTIGLALVYNGLRIRGDQEIITTEHDHVVHHESIRRAAEKNGASVRFISLYDRAAATSETEIVEQVRRSLRPTTRAVGVTWVHSSTGVKLPIRPLAEVLADANRNRAEEDRCLLVVDGVHGFGVEDVDAATLGADFFVAGTHKWFMAPRGTGFIWAPRDRWMHVRPTVPSFDISDELWNAWVERRPLAPTQANFIAPGGFTAYEHQFAIADAAEFHREIGRERIATRIRDLNDRLRRGLAEISGVTVHTPIDSRLAAGICCVEVEGREPAAVVEHLAARRIHATTSPYAVSYPRLAAGIMNTPEEIETAMEAVGELTA